VSGPQRILLGPQSPVRNIGAAVAASGIPEGPLAVISAGWQEAEGDLDELQELTGRQLEDLSLYRRAEDVMHRDVRLATAMRERQDRLIELQRFYRIRLKQLSIAARQVLGAATDSDLAAAEQRHAIAQLRALDRHNFRSGEAIWRGFADEFAPASHELLSQHAEDIATVLGRVSGVIITGGNVAVLINRLRLFGVERMLPSQPIVAWSAGAMALANRIVLFHDRSPEGRRDPELLGAGCGVLPGYVFLPDTRHRLRAGDKARNGLLSRRFAPDLCVGLDNGAALHLEDTRIVAATDVRRLGDGGRLRRVRAA